MKSFFETLFIAAALAFWGWGTIAIGMKFEIKWEGVAYGFTIGGPGDEERDMANIIAYWNNSDKHLRLFVLDSMLADNDFGIYTAALYPMYSEIQNQKVNKHIVVINGQERAFYYAVLTGRQTLNERKFKQMFNFTKNEGYAVTFQQPITKNMGFN